MARELAAAGDRVEIWAPSCGAPDLDDEGIVIHRLPGRFGPGALAALDSALRRDRGRILVQYVPQAFGFKAMNFPFVFWMYSRRRQLDISMMFHEVVFPMGWSRPLMHNVLGASTRVMAAMAARTARRVFVATSSWERYLRRWVPKERPIVCLPMPSTIATVEDREAIAAVRRQYQADGGAIVGHFGTYGAGIAGLLDQILPVVLDQMPGSSMLLIGRASEQYRERLVVRYPRLKHRIMGAGELCERDASLHISACDLMLQPYPDGITTRRTSAMAPLSHGVPLVTTAGHLTESFWGASGGVTILPVAEPGTLAALAVGLLKDEAARRRLGLAGRQLYEDRFHVRHTVAALRRCE